MDAGFTPYDFFYPSFQSVIESFDVGNLGNSYFFVSAREFEPDGVVRLEREIELGDWAWALRVGRWREKNYSLLKIWRERI